MAFSVSCTLCTSGCSLVADIGVWIDSSGSISRTDFYNAQSVVRGIINRFGVSQSGVHISVGSFSDRVSYTRLDDSYDVDTVLQDLDQLPRLRGYTYTDLALETWGSEVFTDRGGARAGGWGVCDHFIATFIVLPVIACDTMPHFMSLCAWKVLIWGCCPLCMNCA